jgi:phosphoglycolate phosphatase
VRAFNLVVFDLDGTLVDSSEDIARAVNDFLSRLRPGTAPLPLARVRGFIGEGVQSLVNRSLAAAGIEPPREGVLPLFLESYRSHLLDTTHLYPGIETALDALLPARLAVLTNKPGDLSRQILAGLGVDQRFSRIYGGGDVSPKPGPAGLRRILREEGVQPEETLMVGDSAIDVQTGRAAGALTAGVLYGLDPEGVRGERPDFLVGDPGEIPFLARAASD